MKTIICGDVHGRKSWRNIINKEDSDTSKIIFVGDYFDTHDNVSAQQQIENFKDIIAFKKSNPDKVILLTGNHDIQYIRGWKEHYSGYQTIYAIDIQELLESALKDNLLQMCYVQNNFLFSHAGVTKTWCQNYDIDLNNIEQSINDLFKYKPHSFGFSTNVGDNLSMTGNDITQSPIWVRPASLIKDKIDGFIQIVGHTVVNNIDVSKVSQFNVILIDALGTSEEYLIINNGVAAARKILETI